jgi:hypothetical protein
MPRVKLTKSAGGINGESIFALGEDRARHKPHEVYRVGHAGDLIEIIDADHFAAQQARNLACGAKPFILEESHPHLREMALGAERDAVHFWSKLATLPSAAPPKRIQRLLRNCLPGTVENIAFSHRIAGEGSLGRPRYVATGSSNGGFVAREAKAWCRQHGAGPRDDRRSMHIQ